jgi:hypothetical protein
MQNLEVLHVRKCESADITRIVMDRIIVLYVVLVLLISLVLMWLAWLS